MKQKPAFVIVENSWLARLAGMRLKARSVAMVLGNKIHLSNTSKEEFLKDAAWLAHELVHVEQFKRYGFLNFLFLYLKESFRNGYYNNKFEVEARQRSRRNNL